MSEFPFFRFFVGDYHADTRHLSTEEHGAYLLLLIDYWQKGFLKNDPSKLKNICQLSRHKFNKYFPTLLEFFEDSGDGYLINKRMEKELQHAGKKSARARAAANARWDATADADAMPEHMPEQCLDDAMSEVRSQKTFTPLPPASGGTENYQKPSRADGTSKREIDRIVKSVNDEAAKIEEEIGTKFEEAWSGIERAEQNEQDRLERLERWPELWPEISELEFDAFHHRVDEDLEIPCDGEFEVYDLSPPSMNFMRIVSLRCQVCGREMSAENPRAPRHRMQEVWNMAQSVEDLLDERAAELRAGTPCTIAGTETPCNERRET